MNTVFGQPYAIACIRGKRDSSISGTVKFYRHGIGTVVSAEICGLPDSETGFFAFHIHEGGNCRGEDFANTGGHFDFEGMPHPMHAGDLPPLLSCHGNALFSVLTERFRPEEVIGRTVVVHSGPDDFRSQPAGNAGQKIACGVIRKV